jgi:adenylate cyclase
VRALPGLMPRSGREGLDEALALIRRAIELDPGYSMAKGLGAFACMSRIGAGHGTIDDVKAGLRYADQAMQEQDNDPSVLAYAGAAIVTLGYRAMGFRVLGFRYDEGLRAIERALGLCPNLLMVQFCAGHVKVILGDGDAALAHFEQAMRISPLDPAMSGFIAATGAAHLMAGRFEQALAVTQRAIEDSPNFVYSHRVLVVALGMLGRTEEAKVAAQRLLELAPGFTVSIYQSVSPEKDPALRKRIAELYRAAGVPR